MPDFVHPPRLTHGCRVALVSPAGPSDADRVERAIARCRAFGLVPVPGPAAAARTGFLAGPDADRSTDLQHALDDPAIDAVWAIRGGYGVMRILDRLDLACLRERPRPFIGFSDNTALHLMLARSGIISFHGPHAGGEFPAFTERCFRSSLFDAPDARHLVPPGNVTTIRHGTAEGLLTGGNLTILAAMCGTPWALQGRGRILLLEDVNEAPYRIDRAFTQLRLAGCLDGVVAIALGGFTRDESATWTDEQTAEVLRERTGSLGIPVVSGLPFGHVAEQWTIPLGAAARIDAATGELELIGR